MNESQDRVLSDQNDEWIRLWRADAHNDGPDRERLARVAMAHTWRFDHKVFWRNFREYAAGIFLLVVFAFQAAAGEDRVGGLIGIGCVSFVMAYIWWNHRGLQPLDPAADLVAYRSSLLARYDDQIRLLRTITFWYLLPLLGPTLWQPVRTWQEHPVAATVTAVIVLLLFAFVRWLNVGVALPRLIAARAKVESMFSKD